MSGRPNPPASSTVVSPVRQFQQCERISPCFGDDLVLHRYIQRAVESRLIRSQWASASPRPRIDISGSPSKLIFPAHWSLC